MINIDTIVKQISKETGYDKDVVKKVCNHVFLQTVEVMKSEDNIQDILFNGLFKFKLKRRYKEDKTLKYTTK